MNNSPASMALYEKVAQDISRMIHTGTFADRRAHSFGAAHERTK